MGAVVDARQWARAPNLTLGIPTSEPRPVERPRVGESAGGPEPRTARRERRGDRQDGSQSSLPRQVRMVFRTCLKGHVREPGLGGGRGQAAAPGSSGPPWSRDIGPNGAPGSTCWACRAAGGEPRPAPRSGRPRQVEAGHGAGADRRSPRASAARAPPRGFAASAPRRPEPARVRSALRRFARQSIQCPSGQITNGAAAERRAARRAGASDEL